MRFAEKNKIPIRTEMYQIYSIYSQHHKKPYTNVPLHWASEGNCQAGDNYNH